MTKKEVHDWQFNEHFNVMLANQLDRVNVNLIYHKDYEKAYGELVQIFGNINRAVEKYDKKRFDDLMELIKETKLLMREFHAAPMLRGPKRAILKRITKTEDALVDNIHLLHQSIMSVMDDMNMLFKRSEKDTRLPIYQTDS